MESVVCQCCGACCRWAGYVHLRPDEVPALAAFLGVDELEFTARYTRLTADRRGLSLTEAADGACVFLTAENHCAVNPVKPVQCRQFPWDWSVPGAEALCALAAGTKAGTRALSKVSALFLAAIAVMMVRKGVLAFIVSGNS